MNDDGLSGLMIKENEGTKGELIVKVTGRVDGPPVFRNRLDYSTIGLGNFGGHNPSILVPHQEVHIKIKNCPQGVKNLIYQGGWPNLNPGDIIEAEILSAECIDDRNPSWGDGVRSPVYQRRNLKSKETALSIKSKRGHYTSLNPEFLDEPVLIREPL